MIKGYLCFTKRSCFCLVNLCLIILFSAFFTSCSPLKNAAYFHDLRDSGKLAAMVTANYTDPLIQNGDIISITVTNIDPSSAVTASQVSSQPITVTGGLEGSIPTSAVTGFLVDKNGYVSLPILGNMKLAGLSTFDAKELITKEALKYFTSPSVQVRYSNFKITVLGEVEHPATFTIPNEKISVLDALGMAGDMTIYGKRENVLVVRDSDGKKEFARLNLNNTEMLKSPFFYLRQNDVVYVEPDKNKLILSDSERTRDITIAASLAATILVLLIRIDR